MGRTHSRSTKSWSLPTRDLPEAGRVMADLERLGISIDFVTTQLENEGIQKFIKAFDSILVQLAKERERIPEPHRSGTAAQPLDSCGI
jgi:hypothetical protein